MKIVQLLLDDGRVNPIVQNYRAIRLAILSDHADVVDCFMTDTRVDPARVNGNYYLGYSSNIATELYTELLAERGSMGSESNSENEAGDENDSTNHSSSTTDEESVGASGEKEAGFEQGDDQRMLPEPEQPNTPMPIMKKLHTTNLPPLKGKLPLQPPSPRLPSVGIKTETVPEPPKDHSQENSDPETYVQKLPLAGQLNSPQEEHHHMPSPRLPSPSSIEHSLVQ